MARTKQGGLRYGTSAHQASQAHHPMLANRASTFAEILSVLPGQIAGAATGLFQADLGNAVPLRLRAIKATVYCDTSIPDVTERFAFISDENLSAVFKFPLPPRSAVYALEATIGDIVIVTEVKEKAQAQAEFNTAVYQGHTAVMAKQEESSQVFTLELGNLEAMQEAVVTVRYLRLLDSVGGALEWVHTATWTPPYMGAAGDAARGPAAAAEQNPRFAGKVSYTLDYTLSLMSNRGIRAVESTAPITCTDLTAEAGTVTSKKVTLSEAVSDPSKDFTLLIDLAPLTAGQHTNSCQDGFGTVSIQRKVPSDKDTQAKEQTVALATFVPRLLPTSDSPTGSETASLHTELIMVVDCSGSMAGSRAQQAREAAIYFIKDLPINIGIRFNVVCFGSNWKAWAQRPQEVTETNMTLAVEWVQTNVSVDMGGTEMLQALRDAVYSKPVRPGYTRSIILLTDGGVSGGEEAAVFQLISPATDTDNAGNTGGASMCSALWTGIQNLKNKVLGKPADDGTDTDMPHAVAVPPAVITTDAATTPAATTLAATTTPNTAAAVTTADATTPSATTLAATTAAVAPAASTFAATALATTPPATASAATTTAAAATHTPPADTAFAATATAAPAAAPASTSATAISATAPHPPITPAVLCLGIGHGVHRGLLDGMAKRSGGVAQYVVDGESIVRKVGFLKKAALCGSSAIHSPHIVCGGALVKLAPHVLPPRLFPDEPLHVLVELTQYEQDIASIELKGKRGNDSDFSVKLPLKGLPNIEGSAYSVLHSLCTVNALLDGTSPLHCAPDGAQLSHQPSTEVVKSAVVAAAMQAHLVTRYTAAVGVMLQSNPLDPKQVNKVYVPLKVPSGADLFKTDGETDDEDDDDDTGAAHKMQRTGTSYSYGCAGRTKQSARLSGGGGYSGGGGRTKQSARMSYSGGYSKQSARVSGGSRTKQTARSKTGGSGRTKQTARASSSSKPVSIPVNSSGSSSSDDMDIDVADTKAPLSSRITRARCAAIRAPSDVMSQLNLLRNVEGWWSDSDELLLDLMSQVPGDKATAVAAARAAQPQHVTAQQWVTVLALAFLRKHCAADRGVWEGMDAKAMAWLSEGWDKDARLLRFTLLEAAKLV